MNDRTIENIKNSFATVAKAFEGVESEEETYQRLKELSTEDLTPAQMLEKLSIISTNSGYGPVLDEFFYKTTEELKSLASQEKKKDELTEELKQKHSKYQKEITAKGLKPTADTHGMEFQYGDDASYQTMDKTNDDIQNDIDLMDKRLDELHQIRKTGDPLEEIPTDTYDKIEGIKEKPDNPNENIDEMNSEFNKINEQVMKTNNYNNPTVDDMENIYHYVADQQTADALLNVEIKYDTDNVKVFLTLEGTSIDESIGKTICYFSNTEEFNKEILPFLVSVHASGGIDEEALLENGDLKSYNNYEEKLSISNNEEISLEVVEELNEEMKLQKNNSNQKVRTLNARGYNLINIYIAIVVLLVLVAVASFIYLIIFKK